LSLVTVPSRGAGASGGAVWSDAHLTAGLSPTTCSTCSTCSTCAAPGCAGPRRAGRRRRSSAPSPGPEGRMPLLAPRRVAPDRAGRRRRSTAPSPGPGGRMSLVAVQSRGAGGVAVGYLATDSLETRRGWPVRSDAHRAPMASAASYSDTPLLNVKRLAGRVDLRWTRAKASAPRGRLRRSGPGVGSPTDRPPDDLAVMEGVQAARRAYRTERAALAARSQDPVSSLVLPRRC